MVKRKEQTTQWSKEKNRQHNGQKKRTKNDLQNTHKTKDRVTRTPLKTGGELRKGR